MSEEDVYKRQIFESTFTGVGKIEHTYYIRYAGEASEVQRGRSFGLCM